jgi:hypothetical protein
VQSQLCSQWTSSTTSGSFHPQGPGYGRRVEEKESKHTNEIISDDCKCHNGHKYKGPGDGIKPHAPHTLRHAFFTELYPSPISNKSVLWKCKHWNPFEFISS